MKRKLGLKREKRKKSYKKRLKFKTKRTKSPNIRMNKFKINTKSLKLKDRVFSAGPG